MQLPVCLLLPCQVPDMRTYCHRALLQLICQISLRISLTDYCLPENSFHWYVPEWIICTKLSHLLHIEYILLKLIVNTLLSAMYMAHEPGAWMISVLQLLSNCLMTFPKYLSSYLLFSAPSLIRRYTYSPFYCNAVQQSSPFLKFSNTLSTFSSVLWWTPPTNLKFMACPRLLKRLSRRVSHGQLRGIAIQQTNNIAPMSHSFTIHVIASTEFSMTIAKVTVALRISEIME